MEIVRKAFSINLGTLILCYLIVHISTEETNETFTKTESEEDSTEDQEEETSTVDLMKQEWVADAVLDVGYYLRNNKFNDFDRRYITNQLLFRDQYKKFPEPPLRSLHAQVYKHCTKGFLQCLEYLQEVALQADLVRSVDTVVIMNQHGWELPRNRKSVENVNRECKRIKQRDWQNAEPFKGPLERFQWRTTAAYFMCWYTMNEVPALEKFAERCDNYANCLEFEYETRHEDPRADNSQPFNCAKYSFCPDPCCPFKHINNYEECDGALENPCYRENKFGYKQCHFETRKNRDLESIGLNHWNVSCNCSLQVGFHFESRFGMCIDTDECAEGTARCNKTTQECINLRGGYGCVCAWGYKWTGTECVLNVALAEGLARMARREEEISAGKLKGESWVYYLYNITIGRFYK